MDEVSSVFNNLLDDVNKYGLFTVIIVIIILLLVYYIYHSNKALEKFEEQSLENERRCKETLMSVGERLVEEILNNDEASKSKRSSLPSLSDVFMDIKITMKDRCKETMTLSRADRMAIYLFHDAIKSAKGVSFLKLSCVCESIRVGSGVRERKTEHNNMPIDLFDSLVHDLINKGSVAIVNDSSIRHSNNKTFISNDKIKFAYAITIFDNNNNALGFVLAEFNCDYAENKLRGLHNKIQPLVAQLTLVLTYNKYLIINLNNTKD